MRNGMQTNALGALSMAFVLWAAAPPESPVADAAQRGDLETVRTLLRGGADVNAAQGDGMTALHWSALQDDAATIEVLVYAGANLEPTTRLGGYTPLHLASRAGNGAAVQALAEAGSDVAAFTTTGVAPLHLAAASGDVMAVGALVEHGADVDVADRSRGVTPLMTATAQNRIAAIAALLEAGAKVAVQTAVTDYRELNQADSRERQRLMRIRRAARDPQPPDSSAQRRQATPAQARSVADTAVADTATADTAAAPPNADTTTTNSTKTKRPPAEIEDPDRPTAVDTVAPTQPVDSTTGPRVRPLAYTDLVGRQGGLSALHYAARDGRMEAARLLLEAGADVDELTGGDQSTPLLIAIINGNFDLAMMLLERGADVNLVSEDGAGPLFAAINNEWALRTWYPQPTASQQQETSYLQLMEALLFAGADPNQRVNTHIWYAAYNAGRMGVDFAGATPFWRAAYATDVAAMRLLVEHGADPNIKTIKPASRRRSSSRPDTTRTQDSTETEEDPSGLPPVPAGGPAVHPLHAASGVGYGTSRVGQQHRHVPDGWLPAVRYLVDELGVDVNVRDHDGYSALHHAASRGDNETIRFLVERGADPTVVSRRGQTTVDMANGPQQRVQPFPETIALLEGYGAKNNDNCLSCE